VEDREEDGTVAKRYRTAQGEGHRRVGEVKRGRHDCDQGSDDTSDLPLSTARLRTEARKNRAVVSDNKENSQSCLPRKEIRKDHRWDSLVKAWDTSVIAQWPQNHLLEHGGHATAPFIQAPNRRTASVARSENDLQSVRQLLIRLFLDDWSWSQHAKLSTVCESSE
jgi:hypothetical protein